MSGGCNGDEDEITGGWYGEAAGPRDVGKIEGTSGTVCRGGGVALAGAEAEQGLGLAVL